MNTTIIMGNLTSNPEVFFTPKGSGIVEFDIAINRRFTKADGEKGEEVTFVPCKAFGRTGEIAMEYLEKGSPVVVEGRLRQETWQTDEGPKRSKLVVVVEKLNLLPSRKHAGGEVSEQDADGSTTQSSRRKRQTAKAA